MYYYFKEFGKTDWNLAADLDVISLNNMGFSATQLVPTYGDTTESEHSQGTREAVARTILLKAHRKITVSAIHKQSVFAYQNKNYNTY